MDFPTATEAAKKAKDNAEAIRKSDIFKQRREVSQAIAEAVELGYPIVRLPAVLLPEIKDALVKVGYKLLDRPNRIQLYE